MHVIIQVDGSTVDRSTSQPQPVDLSTFVTVNRRPVNPLTSVDSSTCVTVNRRPINPFTCQPVDFSIHLPLPVNLLIIIK